LNGGVWLGSAPLRGRNNVKEDLDTPLWGAREIAAVLNLTERQVWHKLEKGQLPAEKVGKLWVSTRRRLLGRISGDRAAA
jgi:hypothetical protein